MREVISITDRILKIKFSIVLVLFILTFPSKHVELVHCLAAVSVDRTVAQFYVLAGFIMFMF